MKTITVPDYYPKFQCSGPQCEDTCCNGWWNIDVDLETYQLYQNSKDEALAPLFQNALSKNRSSNANNNFNFGLLKMRADGSCHFLQQDKLCAIHHRLGATALSDTCRLYPRYLNQFGSLRENSLGISCPEAARLILLNSEPMQFIEIEPESAIDEKPFTSYRFPLHSEGDAEQVSILTDFRAVIVAILQFREVSIGARLMLLGFLLEDVNKITSSEKFSHAIEILPALQDFVGMLSYPDQLEDQFAQIEASIPRKIEMATSLIADSPIDSTSPRFKSTLQTAAAGIGTTQSSEQILSQYAENHAAYYQPFFQNKEYIFENYLVNQVITRLFPFTRGSYLELYRELVCSHSVIQVLLVGIAAKNKGLDDELVIQLFQTFARNSNHNKKYLGKLLDSLHAQEGDSFVDVMWLLKEQQ
ncbi:MAG: flagellin lysine-N-methylase [Gallionellaceae bacterium]|nr:flagellin lysine-N-methylase [Gallionellaceae bacterium]